MDTTRRRSRGPDRVRRITLKDVAARAGVSTATASRALSGTGSVSSQVMATVTDAAAALGYAGNSVASALRQARTNTIGMVVPEIANPFMTELVQEVENALQRRGIQLLLCNSSHDPVREQLALQSLISRQVDGLVVCPVSAVDSASGVRSAAAALPLVQVDQRIDGSSADWIGVDDDAAMRLIAEHLVSIGVRSAAFVGSRALDSSSRHRLTAFRAYAEEYGIGLDPGDVILDAYTAETGRQAVRTLAGREIRPDAVVCAADIIAVGVLQESHQLGIAVPAEMVVTGFDDIEFAGLCTPTLTTVSQPLAAIADRVVELLAGPDDRGARPSIRMGFAPMLQVRGSTSRTGEGSR